MKNYSKLFLILFLSIFQGCKGPLKPDIPVNNRPDTTSHEFDWQIKEFKSQKGISYFWDVFAVSDSNAWAVGQIYTGETDSLGTPLPYTAAHWNGHSWELKRFSFNLSPTYSEVVTPKGIWYFSEKNIWFASYSIFHFDGKETILLYDPDNNNGKGARHLWAFSETDIYAVGDGGFMVHYDGNRWNVISTPTTLRFRDIWGYRDPVSGEKELWLVAADDDKIYGAVFKYDRNGWQTLFDENTLVYGTTNNHTRARAVWGVEDSLYICMIGPYDVNIYKHNRLNFREYELFYNQKDFPIVDIDGQGVNDIFFVGYEDGIAHYNGKSFKTYRAAAICCAGNHEMIFPNGI